MDGLLGVRTDKLFPPFQKMLMIQEKVALAFIK
jgi:hypothetical protein